MPAREVEIISIRTEHRDYFDGTVLLLSNDSLFRELFWFPQ